MLDSKKINYFSNIQVINRYKYIFHHDVLHEYVVLHYILKAYAMAHAQELINLV